MKTAISVPDELFEQAEALARELRTSRSELYSRAMREFLARHAPDQVTEALNRVYDEVEADDDERGFLEAAARQVFRNDPW